MTPADLSLTVLHAVRRAVDDGALRVEVPPRIKVERARPGGTGEYASNVALTLARSAGRSAREVAGIIEERLRDAPGLRGVEITGPGFLNFTLRSDAGSELVRAVLAAGPAYGHGTALAGTTVRFAEVTEPRAVIVAETVVGLLRSQGAEAGRLGGDDPLGERKGDRPGRRIGERMGERIGDSLGERIHVRPGAYDVEALGVDAARWSLLRAAPHDRPLDGPPLLAQHERNSLFRVRYAYSRVRRLLVNGEQLRITPSYETSVDAHELLGALGDHPTVLLAAARHRAPDRVARHLEATADALLAFQHTVLPLGDEKPSAAHRSRLALAEAAGTVLAGGLSVLGISAPDRI
ncbi:ArgS-related anticodon-binding protein NrtL [Streptomyces sp. NBC_00094]|uniref:ArgS-related anticodon-binding protein NrtL n=1 Tax=Streptomyces sp. NBC_00094 TaxID=2903620 RepID=UPI00224E3C57|nr:DALR anticodon-binding domain-containing protein [Streptomyces sp. NBC_00094]MCX5393191.1 DALR anticodon-binding domain-containing protein [Streptomyces sp. NBC_00094]